MHYRSIPTSPLLLCLFLIFWATPIFASDLPPIIMGQPVPGQPVFPPPVPDTVRGPHCSPIVYDFDYYDEDSGVGPVIFSLDPGDPGSIDQDGIYTFVPTFNNIGQHLDFTVSACRPAGNCTGANVRLEIDNEAPVITNLCGSFVESIAGSTEVLSLDVFESCPGDPLDLSVMSAGGLAIMPTVDDISHQLTIQTTAADLGLYPITIRATDIKDTSFCTFTLNIPGDNAITLDSTVGVNSGQLIGGSPAEFFFRVTIDEEIQSFLAGYSNGFRIYSPDGARWDTISHAYLPSWPTGTPDGFDNISLGRFGVDGVGEDTLSYGGLVFFSDRGALPGYDAVAWKMTIVPTQTLLNDGRTICIDTTYNFPPSNQWLWNDSTIHSYSPTWNGPYCFTISSAGCCVGLTGNVNNDPGNTVTLTDLTGLVNNLFVTFTPVGCRSEANTSGDAACGVTLTDLTVMVNYLFVTFTPPASCSDFNEEACY